MFHNQFCQTIGYKRLSHQSLVSVFEQVTNFLFSSHRKFCKMIPLFYCEKPLAFWSKIYHKFYPYPIQFNIYSGSSVYLTKSTYKNKSSLYSFNIYFVIGVLTIPSTIFTLYLTKNNIMKTLFSLILLLIAVFDCLFALSLSLYNKDIVFAYNNLKDLAKSEATKTRINAVGNGKKWKLVSKILQLVTIESFLFVFVTPAFLLTFKFDPYYLIFVALSIGDGLTNQIIRFALMSIFLLEANRLFTLFQMILLFWLEMQSVCISFLENMKKAGTSFVKMYKQLHIITKILDRVFSLWVTLMMCIIMGLVTASIVVAVKYSALIPGTLIWFPVSVSAIDLTTIHMVFPYLIDSNERTGRLKSLKGTMVFRKVKKWEMQTIRALVPIAIKFGNAFLVTRNTQLAYYQAIMARTTEGILF